MQGAIDMEIVFPASLLHASQSEEDVVEQPADSIRPAAVALIGIKVLKVIGAIWVSVPYIDWNWLAEVTPHYS